MRRHELVIRELGESLNPCLRQNGHWKYAAAKRRIGNAMLLARAQKLAPFTRPVAMTFYPRVEPVSLNKRSTFRDIANYVAFVKAFEDILVDCGVLVDDSRDYVKRITIEEPLEAKFDHMLVVIEELDLPEVTAPQEELELENPLPF